jgi:fido (protein-threonine AMPylation protein)
MCLHLLSIEGFEDLDPQCPLGGPDGRKDILCTKNGWRYVAAAYFPAERAGKFKEVRDKFEHDLEGVKKNKRQGLIFLTGQKITPGERKTLEELAKAVGSAAIIYHQERLRGILDSPLGFAARLEHLRIPMKLEEQMAFVLAVRGTQERDFNRMISRVEGKIDHLLTSADELSVWQSKASRLLTTLSTRGGQPVHRLIDAPRDEGVKNVVQVAAAGNLVITIDRILELHRILMFEGSLGLNTGKFRNFQVWIGGPEASREQAVFVPPKGEDVTALMNVVVDTWNKELGAIVDAGPEVKITAITQFHLQFLTIHPFADGNGRISRYLVQAQAQGLGLTKSDVVIRDRANYADAIAKAQAGDVLPLRALIQQAVTGGDAFE